VWWEDWNEVGVHTHGHAHVYNISYTKIRYALDNQKQNWYQIAVDLLQVAPTRKSAQVVTDLQTSCNKVVVKPKLGCVRTACSQLLWQVWNKLLSPCYKVDDGNRLATSCCKKTKYRLFHNTSLRVCCHQLVNNLLPADDIRLVGTTLLRACWPHQPCYKMITTCSRLVNNWEPGHFLTI
jgi:hypothetical protein